MISEITIVSFHAESGEELNNVFDASARTGLLKAADAQPSRGTQARFGIANDIATAALSRLPPEMRAVLERLYAKAGATLAGT